MRQHLLPQREQTRFERRARRHARRRCARLRRGQRRTVELAVLHQRQAFEPHQRRRHHVRGQPAFEHAAQRAVVGFVSIADHVADQPLRVALAVQRHGARRDARRLAQHRLDLARLDAETAQLHLLIETAEEVDAAVRAASAQIAAAIQTRAGPLRIGHEARRRETGPPEIAAREREPADTQLAQRARRQLVAVAVHHVDAARRIRLADRHDGLRAV
ncbi:MAG: hypothetical protein V4793_24805, partial [Paraburkholderia tropica]